MKRTLLLFSILLVATSAWSDEIPTYFDLGPQYMGSVWVGTTTAGGSMAVCQVPSYSCTPSYHFEVGTAPGTVNVTTVPGDGTYTTYQNGTFGPGGTITISVNGNFFLSGYLLSAYARTSTTTYEGTSMEFWEREIGGIFRALVLNSEYWGNTDPQSVGGSFSILTGFPHSPYATGGGHLAVAPVPEPATLALLLGGVGLIGRRLRRNMHN